jgi:hypothetical protein
MSSNQRKRKAASSKSRSNKRQKKKENADEQAKEGEEPQVEVIDVENQLDEKEEKKEREVKENINASALPVNDPDLAVGTVDKDLICAICFCFLTKPQSNVVPSLSFSHFSRFNFIFLTVLPQALIAATVFAKLVPRPSRNALLTICPLLKLFALLLFN